MTTSSSVSDRLWGVWDVGKSFASAISEPLAQSLNPQIWGAFGITSAISSAVQFGKGKVVGGVTGLLAGFGSIGMAVMGGASRQEAEVAVHAGALAFGGTLAAKGAQDLVSGPTGSQPVSFFSSATGKLLTGLGVVYGALKAGPRLTTYMSLLGTCAMTSALFAKVGIKRIQEGRYLSGIGYTAAGITGIAGSVYTAYTLMATPQETPEFYYTDEVGHFEPKEVPEDVERRRVKIATVYNNHGNEERDRVSEIVVKNQDEYAEHWGYEREVISDAHATEGRCWIDRAETVRGKCTPYFEKLEYAVAQCHDPESQGKWVLIIDDDMPITNQNIDLMRAIDHLRRNPDGSFVPARMILVEEAGDWPGLCNEHVCFKLPGIPVGEHHPKTAVNTGFILFEATGGSPQCKFLERALEHRNTPMDRSCITSPIIAQQFASCPTVGVCEGATRYTSLGDQTAVALAIQEGVDREGEGFFQRVVHVVPQSDKANKYRSHIALNTMARGGCFWPKGAPAPFDIGDHDNLPQYRHGVWIPRALCGQPAGVALMGRVVPKVNGYCVPDKTQPIENLRVRIINDMLEKSQKPIIWEIMNTDDGGGGKGGTKDMVVPNHQLLTYMHGPKARYVEDTSPMTLMASHPFKDKDGVVYTPCLSEDGRVYEPCNPSDFEPLQQVAAPYWRKVAYTQRFVHEPIDPEYEHILVHGDTDLWYNRNLDLYQMLETERARSTKGEPHILVAADNHDISVTNTGFFMVRRTETARKIVDFWAEGVNMPSFDPRNPDCPTFGWGGASQKCGLHEQSVMNSLLYVDGVGPHIHVIGIRDDTRPYDAVDSFARKGHWWRTQKDWRGEVRYSDPWWLQYQPDDAVIQAAGVPKVGYDYHQDPSKERFIRREVVAKAMKSQPPLRYLPIWSVKGPQIEEIED